MSHLALPFACTCRSMKLERCECRCLIGKVSRCGVGISQALLGPAAPWPSTGLQLGMLAALVFVPPAGQGKPSNQDCTTLPPHLLPPPSTHDHECQGVPLMRSLRARAVVQKPFLLNRAAPCSSCSLPLGSPGGIKQKNAAIFQPPASVMVSAVHSSASYVDLVCSKQCQSACSLGQDQHQDYKGFEAPMSLVGFCSVILALKLAPGNLSAQGCLLAAW